MTFFIEGHAVYLAEGDLLLVAPFARHTLHRIQAEGEVANIVLRPSKIRCALPRILESPSQPKYFLEHCQERNGPLYLRLGTSPLKEVRVEICRLAEEMRSRTSPSQEETLLWEARLEMILLQAWVDRRSTVELPEAGGGTSLSQVLGYVQSNLSTVTLQSTAAHLGLHPSHLSRVLSRATGRSFSELVQVLRLDEACTLLLKTQMSEEDVMAQVGYTGKANFYEIFKRRFGMAPGLYRAANRPEGR